MAYHIPALLKESIEGLDIRAGGIYVDVTFGGGGHSRAILEALEGGRLIAFDQDADAADNKPADSRFVFLHQNFRYLKNNLRFLGINQIEGLIGDLGVSFHQFDTAGRGFTFRTDSPLDMRMNPETEVTAAEIVQGYTADSLHRVFREYGEFGNSRAIAAAIITARERSLLRTSGDLREAVSKLVPARQESKFLARLFQALRIEVNRELDNLKDLLVQCASVIRPGGRMVFITYHSLEDRLVKNYIRNGNFEGIPEKDLYGNEYTPFRALNRKVITPTVGETEQNQRARSARLRIAERTEYGISGRA